MGLWHDIHPRWRALLAVLLVAGLVAVGVRVWWGVTYCAQGITKADDGCVGISDGSHGAVFGTGTADALRIIGEENARIAADPGDKEIVSIAYVVPIPPPGVEDAYATRLAGDVMGAAVAQRQANRTTTLGDRPLIRLLVVNVGDSATPAREPIDQLIEMAGPSFGEHKLMAVAVSGKSLDPLTELIEAMVTAEVPVIVSHLTAEQITSTPTPPDTSLARVAPTTADEAAALAAYLRPTTGRALIVQNSDQEDRYAQSLGAAFQMNYSDPGHVVLEPVETFIGSVAGAANVMPSILRNICHQRPDVVFFAGRSPELAALVSALPARPCLDHPIRLVTGDDGASFAAAVAGGAPELSRGLEANASVAYTALAHPQAWRQSPEAFAPASAAYLTGNCPECFPTLFPGRNLDDSYAIMAYDAVMTAVTAIRSPTVAGGPVSSSGAVIQEFKRIHGPDARAGASGWISLDPSGYPINKAAAIIGVTPTGASEFVQLSSPSGTPCTPNTAFC